MLLRKGCFLPEILVSRSIQVASDCASLGSISSRIRNRRGLAIGGSLMQGVLRNMY